MAKSSLNISARESREELDDLDRLPHTDSGPAEQTVGVAAELLASQTQLAESQMLLSMELAATQRLQEISTQLIGEDDPAALYEKILDAAVLMMRSQFASIQVLDPERGDGGELRLLGHRGFDPRAAAFWERVRPSSESTCGVALRTGERVIVHNIEACEWMAGSEDHKTYLDTGILAVQTTPLTSRGGRVVGMISTHWNRPHSPTENDLRLLDVLARQAADLIERRTAEEALRKSEERFRFLDALGEATRSLSDPSAVMATAARLLGEHLGVSRCAYADVEPDNNRFIIRDDWRVTGTATTAGDYSLDLFGSRAAADLRHGRVLVIRNVDSELTRADGADMFGAIGIKAIICCPLVKDGTLRAMMAVHNADPRDWTNDEVALVREAADRSWAHIERVTSSFALRASEERYRSLFESIDEGFCTIEMMFDENERPYDYRFIDISPSFERQTGLTDAIGKTMLDFAPNMEQHWFDTYGRVALTGESVRFENHARQLHRWYDVYAFRVERPEEHRVGVLFNDITTRKRTEVNLTFLADLAEDFARLTSADEIMTAIGAKLGAFLGVKHCLFSDIDEPRDKVVVTDAWRADAQTQEIVGTYRLSDFVTEEFRQAARRGEQIVVHNTRNDPRTDAEAYAAHDIRTFITVPFRRSGEWRYLLTVNDSSARDWRDDEIALVRDVTGRVFPRLERARAEEALRSSETQLRVVTDAMPALISYIDADLTYRFVNRAYTDWFGLSATEVIGKKTAEILGADATETLRPHMEAALAGKVEIFESEIPYKEGGTRFIRATYTPDTDDGGKVKGFFVLVLDITESKLVEEKIRESYEFNQEVIDSIAAHIAVLDEDGTISAVNEAWRRFAIENGADWTMRGVGPGTNYLEVCRTATGDDAGDAEAIRDGIFRLLKHETGHFALEYPCHSPSAERWFLLSVSPMGRGGAVVVHQNITERKRVELELQKAHAELEMRVAARTHELATANEELAREVEERKELEKTRIELVRKVVTSQEEERRRISRDLHDQLGQQMTALRLKLSALRGVTGDEGEVAEHVLRLQDIADALDSEISFLSSELRPTALDDLGLEEALKGYTADWSEHFGLPLDFHSNFGTESRAGSEIETHLYRIAQEALNNVVKHSKATHVATLLERTADGVVLVIEDNGAGFDTDRVEPSSPGHGLGLLGMRERANLIGGEIEVESEVGRGTTIYVKVKDRGN